jgi:WD40 repeat protein
LPENRIVVVIDHRQLEVRDLGTGMAIAKTVCPEKDRRFSIRAASPDGSLVAVALGAKKDAPLEVWFLSTQTLKEQGKLVGKGSPHRYGWGPGEFTPDSKRFVAIDASGDALVWNVADQKIERCVSLGGAKTAWQLAISPDSKTAAVGWLPPYPGDDERGDDVDPEDLPQPRVSILDLTGKTPTRVLIAPGHGYAGSLAFALDSRTIALGSSGAIHLFDLKK